jgi:acyl dehydratase
MTATYPIARHDLIRYAAASGDLHPLHWNPAAAAAAGLPGVVAHGAMVMGLALRTVTAWAGDPGRVLECSARFLHPVTVPDGDHTTIRVGDVVQAAEDDGRVRLSAQVWCEDRVVARISAVVAPG